MAVGTEWALSKNQQIDRANELDVEGEARLYRALRHFWHPVLYSHELGDGPQRVTIFEQDLVVVRLDGQVAVFNDLCAHRGTALSLGTVVDGAEGQELRCPYHGWQYNTGGSCTFAPQRPDLAGQLRARVKRYNAEERYGLIWVCLEDEPRFPIPAFPEYDDPAFDTVTIPSTNWKCSAPRRTENYTDLSHFAIVHDGWLGDVNHPLMPEHEVWREEPGILRMLFDKPIDDPADNTMNKSMTGGATLQAGDDDGSSGSTPTRNYHISMPLTVHLDIDTDGQHYILFFHPTPVGPKEIRNFTIGARNFGSPETIREDIVKFSEVIYDQDQPIVESQRPEQLSEDLTLEMHLKGVDTFSLSYRQWLVELAKDIEGQ